MQLIPYLTKRIECNIYRKTQFEKKGVNESTSYQMGEAMNIIIIEVS